MEAIFSTSFSNKKQNVCHGHYKILEYLYIKKVDNFYKCTNYTLNTIHLTFNTKFVYSFTSKMVKIDTHDYL